MKLTYLIAVSLLIISCTSTEANDELVDEPTIGSSESANEQITPAAEEPTERDFDFSEMPRMWWLLTKTGDEFIRYNHWDAQDETIEFIIGKDGSDWMNMAYAHDSDMGDVTDFKATLTEGEDLSQVKGSFTYHSRLEEESNDINFYWNQLKHYIEFENFSSDRLYYAPEEELGYFLYEETFREED
jgi:hypothetical protein